MLNKSKTKNYFVNFFYSSQKNEKRATYISRSINKKKSTDKNKNNRTNNNSKEIFKMSSTLMEMRLQTKINKYKKKALDYSHNNSFYNLIASNQYNNNNIRNNIKEKENSLPKAQLLLQGNSANNSSLIFNINEDMKMNNNNSNISSNKENIKKRISNFEKQNNCKNSYYNNNNNANIEKFSFSFMLFLILLLLY